MRIEELVAGPAADQVAEVLLLVDVAGNVVDANPAALALYGHSLAEIHGFPLSRIEAGERDALRWPPGDLKDVVGTGIQTVHRRKDGSHVPVEVKTTVFDLLGEQVTLVAVHDITELKRAEAALALAEAKYATVLRVSPDPVMITRLADGHYLEVNPGFTRLFGHTADDTREWGISACSLWVDPSDRALLVAGLNVFGLVNDLEARFQCKDGRVVTGLVSAQLIEIDGERCILGEVRDISETRHAAESRQANEEGLKRAQHEAGMGSWTWDIKTNHTEYTDGIQILLGVEPGSLTGTLADMIAKRVHPDDRHRVENATSSVAGRSAPESLEFRIIRPDGTIKTLLAQPGETVLDEEGNPSLLTGTVQDVTERNWKRDFRSVEQEILAILNAPGDLKPTLRRVVAALKRGLQVDAVGLRLRDGEGFPYFVQRGFPRPFLRTENDLIAHDAGAHVQTDRDDSPLLECVCGLVLSGGSCGGASPLTPGGSFWTNNARAGMCAEADELHRLRHRCLQYGYTSMAHVPIRSKGVIAGLIQLNDRQGNRFTLERVEALEAVAAHIGQAIVRKEVEGELVHHAARLSELAEERERHLAKLLASLSSLTALICEIMETRDPYTAGHGRRVAQLAVVVSQRLGMTAEQVEEIRIAALIHDVGKVSIPAEILAKPGKLRDYEFDIIRTHSEVGRRILASADVDHSITEMVFQHHERCDGSGYPRGLSAEALLDGAKVLMVSDVVEAMVSDRPYRRGLGIEAALAEIQRGSGLQYDPLVVAACVAAFRNNEFVFEDVPQYVDRAC